MTDLASAWCIPLVPLQAAYWDISLTDAGRNMSGNIFVFPRSFQSDFADARSGRYHCSSTLPTIRSPSCPILVHVHRLLHDPVVCPFSKLDRVPCRPMPSRTYLHNPSDYWPEFHSRYVLLPWHTPKVIAIILMAEHARKIGIWIWAVIFSPYLGPFLSSLIAEYSDWRTSVWTLFGLFGLAVVLVVLFADETLYDRKHAKEQPPRPEGFLRDRFESLVGIRGWKATHRPSGWKEFGALWHIMTRPYFLLVLCISSDGKANSSLPAPHIHVVNWSKRVPPALCLPSTTHRIRLLQLDDRSALYWPHACLGHWGNVWPLFQRLARQQLHPSSSRCLSTGDSLVDDLHLNHIHGRWSHLYRFCIRKSDGLLCHRGGLGNLLVWDAHVSGGSQWYFP